jgi:hypothetical protein
MTDTTVRRNQSEEEQGDAGLERAAAFGTDQLPLLGLLDPGVALLLLALVSSDGGVSHLESNPLREPLRDYVVSPAS